MILSLRERSKSSSDSQSFGQTIAEKKKSGRTPNVRQVVDWLEKFNWLHHGTIKKKNRAVVSGIGQFLQG
jgi:hypothetical protein